MKPLVAIPEPLQFPIKLVGALIAVIVAGIVMYLGAVLSVYVLAAVIKLIFIIFT
jgi:type IV secretory pathway VirB2 component (pilin)